MAAEVDPHHAAAEPGGLAYRTAGTTGPGLALVHGFAQTGGCFGPFGADLATDHRTILVDLPGHGGSLRHLDADLPRSAELFVDTVGTSVLVGYSMGARLALHAALQRPDQVTALVLVGGTAGIEDPAERAERRRWDEATAARLEAVGLEQFLEEWLAMPMFAGLPAWARFEEERRHNTVEGLAASLRHAGTGSMEPLWDRLEEIRCPTLLLTGAADERYGALASRLVRGLGGPAQHVEVPAAGHAAHLERPQPCAHEVRRFLAAHGPTA